MSVFLRWGIFGILGFAALLYAYNASKRMAERHAQRPVSVAQAAAPVAVPETPAAPASVNTPKPAQSAAPPPPAHCQAELAVARRAIEARRNGEPLDRLLRIQEIAFEEAGRRVRLETVATRYFTYEGDFSSDALRVAVISDCLRASP